MRQRILILFCIIMLVTVGLLPRHAEASDKEAAGVDIAIVVDTSGSMKSTDPDRIAIEAAKLFIDMTEISDTRIALVTFSDKLGSVTKLTDINGTSDKESLKSSLNGISYKGDTDMGRALKKGYELLKDGSKDNKHKAILFFTDGNIDLGKSKTRTNDDSYQDTKKVIEKSAKDGIPIYTIGLNSDGSVDQKLLSNISEKTAGRNYLVDKADVLPEIFNEIFADFINSNLISLGEYVTDGKNYTDIPFEISNNSVLEANIIMLSKKKLKNIVLKDPKGDLVALNSDKALISESKQYTMLKMITPKKGKWNLRIKGSNGCKVHINLIFNYKVELASKAKLVAKGPDSYIKVTSWLEKKGEKFDDEALYSGFTGKVYCKSSAGEKTYPMKNEGTSFTAQIPIGAKTGNFEIYTRVESDSIYRVSDISTIKVKNSPPVFNKFPSLVELKGLVGSAQKEKIALSDYVTDPDGDDISYKAELQTSGKNIATVKVKDNKLIIIGGKKGKTTVKITATDSKGAATTTNLAVSVNSKFSNIWPVIIIIILSALLLAFLIFILLKLKRMAKVSNQIFYGSLGWVIVGDRNREQLYQLGYEKGTIPLSKCISEPALNELGLAKVKMHMTNSVEGIELKNSSKNCIMVMGFGGSPQGKLVLMNGDFTIISGKYMGNDISVKITYSLY